MVKEKGFAELMKDLVVDKLGEGYEVNIREVVKNNGTALTGLSIGEENCRIAPTIYLETLEEEFDSGIISANEAAEQIVSAFKREGDHDASPIVSIFSDAEEIYRRVYPKVINAAKNEELLAMVSNIRFLDLAEIFLVKMEMGGNIGNVTIKNDMVKMLDLDVERLEKAAYENMIKKGIDIRSLTSMIMDLIGNTEDAQEALNGEMSGNMPMTIVTNPEKYNGAYCLLCKDIFVEMSKKMGCDLYILPSSIHEVIVVPAYDRFDENELRNMVQDVNRTTVSSEDYLSDSIYRFDFTTAQLQIA